MIAAMDRTSNNKTVQTAPTPSSPSNAPSRQCLAEMHRNNAFHCTKCAMEKSIAWMVRMKADDAQGVRGKLCFIHLTSFTDLCAADRAGCQFKCHNSPEGPVCSCPLGEQLVNKTRCEPENECLDPRSCSQHCTDEKHGFTCSCDAGYELAADKRTCKVGENRGDMRVYVSNRNRIYWSDSNLENWRTFAAQVGNS